MAKSKYNELKQNENDLSVLEEIIKLNNNEKFDIENLFSKISNKNSNSKKREGILERIIFLRNSLYKDKEISSIDLINILISINISKLSSRQGSIKEKYDFDFCNEKTNKKIIIKKLPNCGHGSLRPIENGKIMNFEDCKKYKNENNIQKFIHKTLDGELLYNEKKIGYVFHKNCNNNGGHQDNVFIEISLFIKWIKKYNNNNKYFLLIINGNKNIDIFIKYKNELLLDNCLIMNNEMWIEYANNFFI